MCKHPDDTSEGDLRICCLKILTGKNILHKSYPVNDLVIWCVPFAISHLFLLDFDPCWRFVWNQNIDTKNKFALRWKYVRSISTSLGRKSKFAYECMVSISSNMITYHRILCALSQVLCLSMNNNLCGWRVENKHFSMSQSVS